MQVDSIVSSENHSTMKNHALLIPLLTFAAALVACSDKAPANAPATAASAAGVPVEEDYRAPSPARPTTLTATPKSTNQCSIDMVNYAVAAPSNTVVDKAHVKLQGWAADATQGIVPRQVYVEIEGSQKMWARAVIGIDRPDVVTHFNKPELGKAGWSAFINLSTLPAGKYTLHIVQILPDNSETLCNPQRTLTLP
jgi:hypothetical protein